MSHKEDISKPRLIRVGLSYPTLVEGKIPFSELPTGVPEVEVGMEYVTDTTDEEFLAFPEGKILLMEEKVQDAMFDRWYEIMKLKQQEDV